jgi:poly-gamma-glutamate capsule biosynthesis protein CapA/YwtB (metallophosphatase superfamily)
MGHIGRWVVGLLAVLVLPGFCCLAGEHPVTLLCVGDVLLGRGVAKAVAKHGADYPFAKTRHLIQSADIAFCNLECALTTRTQTPRPKGWALRADSKTASILAKAGFDIVSLANNHTLDFGQAGLDDTRKTLKSEKIAFIETASAEPAIVERGGLRIGFLGFRGDSATGQSVIAAVKHAQSKCDALVAYFHWGYEYARRPNSTQRSLAHAAIDAGADLVIGSHPHVLQTVETYKGKTIVYSMGNFVWDSRIFDSGTSAMYMFDVRKGSIALKRTIPITVRACKPRLKPT